MRRISQSVEYDLFVGLVDESQNIVLLGKLLGMENIVQKDFSQNSLGKLGKVFAWKQYKKSFKMQ